MPESFNDEKQSARADARDQFADAVAKLIEQTSVRQSFTADEAMQDGYAPIEAFVEATGKSRVHAASLLLEQCRSGTVERILVGKAYWYRASQ